MQKANEKFVAVLDLIRWTKPYGTLLVLAPTLWSLVIAAKGLPPLKLIVIFSLGSFLMRSAGCVTGAPDAASRLAPLGGDGQAAACARALAREPQRLRP